MGFSSKTRSINTDRFLRIFFGVFSIVSGVITLFIGILQACIWDDLKFLPIALNCIFNPLILVMLGLVVLIKKEDNIDYPVEPCPFKDVSDRVHNFMYSFLLLFAEFFILASLVMNGFGVKHHAMVYSAVGIPLVITAVYFLASTLIEYRHKSDYLRIEEVEVLKNMSGIPAPRQSASQARPSAPEPAAETPVAPEPAPTQVTDAPATPANAPTQPAPVQPAPTQVTDAPATPANAPTQPAPTQVTDAPATPTNVPAQPTPKAQASTFRFNDEIRLTHPIKTKNGTVLPSGMKGKIVSANYARGEFIVAFEDNLQLRLTTALLAKADDE